MSSIEESFAAYFEPWGLTLPHGAAGRREAGLVTGSEWHVRYVFGTDERGDYLDFLASNRMTDECHVRLREGLAPEHLPAPQPMYSHDGTEADRRRAERGYVVYNRGVAGVLRAKGFMGDAGSGDDQDPSEGLGTPAARDSVDGAAALHYEEVETDVDPSLPLIYLWQVHDDTGRLVYAYVGKAKGGAGRPRTHYDRNVRNLLAGRPYRKGKPGEFRRVHRELAEAVRNGHVVTLTLLCNVGEGEDIDELERRMQALYDTP